MKQNQNPRPNRQPRQNQNNMQNNNQKRTGGKGRSNRNPNQKSSSQDRQMDSRSLAGSLRGSAKQLYEKYKLLAQEKRPSDRLESETLYQYADHYYRIYAESAAVEAAAQLAQERERAKRAEADLERRANTMSQEPAFEDQEYISVHQASSNNGVQKKTPKAKQRKDHSDNNNDIAQAPQEKRQPKPQPQPRRKPLDKLQDESKSAVKELMLDLEGAANKANESQTSENTEIEIPKKRRGRPAKPKGETVTETLTSPVEEA